MEQISFLAFDLGATSGRSILGTLRDGKLQMKELTRFPNQILELGGHYYWNIFSLYEHLKAGMIACAKEGAKITSIGIDTWGVDFALIGEDGQILGMPLAYRDLHTTGAPEEYFAKVMPRKEVYDLTGIQVMNFNSLYQLYAMQRDHSSPLKAAVRALFMPDALSYMLTGKMATEYTIASTSQILNPRTKKMEAKLLEKMGVKGSLFGEVVPTGTVVGTLTDALAAETGLDKVPVVAVAGHDTASAVAAVPASDEKFAYLSSGTWSLMGIEVKDPVITDETAALNITNEGGVEGTTRLLKNITGMWNSGTVHQRVEKGRCRIFLPGDREDGRGGDPVPLVHRPGRSLFRESAQHGGCDPQLLCGERAARAADACRTDPLHLRIAGAQV